MGLYRCQHNSERHGAVPPAGNCERASVSPCEWAAVEPTTFLVRVGADLPGGGRLHEPTLDLEGFLVCPHCGNDDLAMWADDGDADLADYLDCHHCGLEAVLVRREDPDLTQNGLSWKVVES